MSNVEVELNMTAREGAAGDRVTVTEERARQLIRGGAAVPATKQSAKAVGEPPETAATSRK